MTDLTDQIAEIAEKTWPIYRDSHWKPIGRPGAHGAAT